MVKYQHMLNYCKRLTKLSLLVLIFSVASCVDASRHREDGGKKSTTDSVREALNDSKDATLFRAGQDDAQTWQQAMQRAQQALQIQELDRALYEFVRALELKEDNDEALYQIGRIHSQKRNFDLAAMAYRLALQKNENHVFALEEMGLISLQRRRYDEAERFLKKAMDLEANRWRVHNGLGIIADIRKDYGAAYTHYHAALKLKPGSPPILNNLGYSQYLSGNWENGFKSIKLALTNDPKYKQAWLNLGLIYTRYRRYDEALSVFENVMNKADAHEKLGYLCMIEGRYDDAERFLNTAINLSPTYHEEANKKLATLKVLRGQSLESGNSSSNNEVKNHPGNPAPPVRDTSEDLERPGSDPALYEAPITLNKDNGDDTLVGLPYHFVQAGETIFRIATERGLDYHILAWWNDIEPPYDIEVGQRLAIPSPSQQMESGQSAVSPSSGTANDAAAVNSLQTQPPVKSNVGNTNEGIR